MTEILACIDGSIYSESVASHAAWAANGLSASVELLHTIDRQNVAGPSVDLSGNLDVDQRETLLAELADLDAKRARLAQKTGRLVLDQAAQQIRNKGVDAVSETIRHDTLVDALKDLEANADLVVIGKRGEAADFAKLHLGSNLERVLRGASKPVLVSARAFRPIKRLVVAYDGGKSSGKAVSFMADNPQLFAGIACHILTVGAGVGEAELQQAAIRLDQAGLAVSHGRQSGEPDEVIANHVEEATADLLVMGAYGHSRIRTLIIGSTTTALIRSCKVPVLLFR